MVFLDCLGFWSVLYQKFHYISNLTLVLDDVIRQVELGGLTIIMLFPI